MNAAHVLSNWKNAACLAGWILLGGVVGCRAVSAEPQEASSVDVLHYTAMVQPDIEAGTLTGTVDIRFILTADGQNVVAFDRGALVIDRVTEGAVALAFEQRDGQVQIHLPAPTGRGQTREVRVEYHGAPRFGLQFAEDRSQAYTIFSTWQWLVCVDEPDDKATLDLSVVLPEGLEAVGSGGLVEVVPRPDGMTLWRWRQRHPVPSYTFGFAAGRFEVVTDSSESVALRYLAEGFSSDDIARAFRDTPDMLRFFEERAGVPYPEATYTQVLVVDTFGQEASGFSLLSEAYGRTLLDDSTALSLSAHELAHQWWGNMVTCLDWTHFWLNEGFATFMAAAYREHRFGRATYLRDIEVSQARYEQVRQEGGDRSLVFPDWDRPTANDRTLVYHKGAYVLHLLRERLGDRLFWEGIRQYTRAYFGQSVTTPDFQRAMEQASGADLSDFFAEWVYLSRP